MNAPIGAPPETLRAAEAPAPGAYGARRAQNYALALLFGIYACHLLDRGIAGIVLEPIKHEFHATDTQLGLISAGYTTAFILAMLPVGALIDRLNRVRLLAGLVFVWSAFTALAGTMTSLPALIATRLGVGAAEAGGHPISMSLIGDIFPPQRRGSAVGAFYVATGVGAVVSFLMGGLVASHYGWRAALFIAGAPGLILALLALTTLKEPVRGGSEAADQSGPAPSARAAFSFVIASAPLINLAMAGLLASAVVSSFQLWLASYFVRKFGLNLAQVGFIGALGPGVLSAAGALTSGYLADLAARGGRHRAGYVALGSTVAMTVLGVAYAQTSSLAAAICLAMAFGVVAGMWMAPIYTLVLMLTPPRMRGVAVGMAQAAAAVGSGYGPLLVGMLSDRLGGHIETALAIGLGVFSAWAALHAFFGAFTARRALAARDPASA